MKPAHHNTVIAAAREHACIPDHAHLRPMKQIRDSSSVSAFMYESALGFIEGWRAAERYHAAKQEKPHAQ